ncbi:N-acetylglucosamine-6-phosphate deacetylase [Persicitalea jodogahamensis]|uniref:N-acetylglucosamine-6-phosphate deacetylase n=1 Tax=Persicitalea jodogahamensis TaxID=402147 RepID=A0A8J3D0Y9_9BACT|nr:N-acetylglucosamine-6-phosphate deacetylase [Persicitalea jodogahamensis]GHB54020.1 N-acetylglucosamine-6-phosphate deacetylase [Persicitalea jodogahamensis]
MTSSFKITNGTLLTPHRAIPNGTLVVENGLITAVLERGNDTPDLPEIDAQGKYVSPGFVELHVHGGGGHDFMDGTLEAFLQVAETHARFGTTAMSPTTLTSSQEALYGTLELYEEANKVNKKGAKFLGLHLEGPYFAMSQRGAQDPRYIRNPDPTEYREIIRRAQGSVTRWSIAPELPGALEMGRFLRSQGIIASVAHTDAIHEDVVLAAENGYSLMTHLYSGMLGVTRRDAFRYAGAVESAFLLDDMDVEIITDGIHLPPPLLQLIYKIKGPDRIALITDAMRAASLPPGDSILGPLDNGLKVLVEDGVAKLPDRTAFAGSVATADRLLRTMTQQAHVPLLDAVKMMTATPARIMGQQDRLGSLTVGKAADVVLFDENIEISMTIIDGKVVYSR